MNKPSVERIQLLNQGHAQTKNLMEALSIDFHLLIQKALPDIVIPEFVSKTGITKKMQLAARAIYEQRSTSCIDNLKNHHSDTLRGIACYIIAWNAPSLENAFAAIKPLADDSHFGVREWAWMAVRSFVASNPIQAIEILKVWTQDPSERVRRFASEITRPRGVWCAHIRQLRDEPWLAMDILELLKNDEASYVQLSVGNWLNDASKDHPEWVKHVCARWQMQSQSDSAQKICKRALRTINKGSKKDN